MSKLDWSRITAGIGVLCKTEEEARTLLAEANERGFRWFSNEPLTGETYWNTHREDAVYSDFDGTGVVHGSRKTTSRTIIPYADLLPEKLRICEVLGVEIDEPFDVFNGSGTRIYANASVCKDKVVRTNIGTSMDGDMLCLIIGGELTIDRITRKPRFTEDEVAAMRVLYAAGVHRVERSETALIARTKGENNGYGVGWTQWCLPFRVFKSIATGQSVEIVDVIGK